ncbi:MAG: hypothetical protein ACTHNW_19150 [Mucilaginibacter sp.]
MFALNYGMGGSYNMDGSGITYIIVNTYLVNNSNDTLCYWGSDCHQTQFFSISKNPYLYLKDMDCKKETFVKCVLPPHRSVEIKVLLSKKKELDTIIPLNITMKLFKWRNNSLRPNNDDLISTLSDNLTLKFDKRHNSFSGKHDFEIKTQKDKIIPPDVNLYLLTDNDRKLYTLTVDQKKILAPRDTVNWSKKKVMIFKVPVTLHNNSNNTLRFLTMTCSWFEDFSFNIKNIQMYDWACESNFSIPEEIPPHGSFTRQLSVCFYPNQIKEGTKLRIAMSLTIPQGKHLDFDLYPFRTSRFNQIWTNEIVIP